MKKINAADYVDKKAESKANKAYYGNKICAVPMCNNAGTSKNNVTGEGQWYCSVHVRDVNEPTVREDRETGWRETLVAKERAAHPERERQPEESMDEFAKRSIQFMRERMGMIGRG